jgi:hypothetical protein
VWPGSDAATSATVASEVAVSQSRLPEPVEAAIYFVCSEALTNVAKHADATAARVDITEHNSHVTATIEDDGVGGAVPTTDEACAAWPTESRPSAEPSPSPTGPRAAPAFKQRSPSANCADTAAQGLPTTVRRSARSVGYGSWPHTARTPELARDVSTGTRPRNIDREGDG